MKQELFEQFTKVWPERFSEVTYFECGDGWFDLLWQLCEELEDYGSAVKVLQVKEKFGGLRFYTNYSDDTIDAAVERAEQEAAKTCERCGEPGELRGGSWLKTLCNKCV